jgi:hypothetical protein
MYYRLADQTPAAVAKLSITMPPWYRSFVARPGPCAAVMTRLMASCWPDHCSLSSLDVQRLIGSDRQEYIVTPQPADAPAGSAPRLARVRIGSREDSMRTVATVDRYILPGSSTAPDKSHDLAIGVVKGPYSGSGPGHFSPRSPAVRFAEARRQALCRRLSRCPAGQPDGSQKPPAI